MSFVRQILRSISEPAPLWSPALQGLNDKDPACTPPPAGLPPLTLDVFHQTIEELKPKATPPEEGFFPVGGMIHKVFGQTTPMAMGLTPVFYELAHYGVGFAISERSSFAKHPLLRGLMTFLYSSTIGYGSVEEAEKMAGFLFRMHSGVKGTVPYPVPGLSETTYSATDPAALLWVFATLMKGGLDGYEIFVETLTPAEKERFYQESKPFGQMFGVPAEILPVNYEEFLAYFQAVLKSPVIWVSPEAKETGRLLLENLPAPLAPYFRALTAATLPPELREAFGLPWNETVARQADQFTRLIRAGHAIAPSRFTESPMKSAWRARRHEGDHMDELTRRAMDFAFAFGTEARANTKRPIPASRLEVLVKSINRARKR